LAFRPVSSREQIICDVYAADPKKRQCFVEVAELAGPSVGKYQVIEFSPHAADELGTISNVKCNARIHAKMPTRNGDRVRVRVDRLNARQSIAAFQDPSRSVTDASANFKKAPPGFGCGYGG
jgi:hypothetical protein